MIWIALPVMRREGWLRTGVRCLPYLSPGIVFHLFWISTSAWKAPYGTGFFYIFQTRAEKATTLWNKIRFYLVNFVFDPSVLPILILAVIGAGLIGQVGARQQRPEGGRPARPDFDIRANRSPAAASGRALAELSRRASAGEPGAARLHPHTGALRLLDAPGISSIPGASAAQLQALLQQFADRIGLDDDDVASLSAVRDYSSASTGLRHVTFAQSIDGLPVFGGIVSLHIAADGTIVRVTSSSTCSASGR